jgi:uncharacterized RDD family membrane protein YckC
MSNVPPPPPPGGGFPPPPEQPGGFTPPPPPGGGFTPPAPPAGGFAPPAQGGYAQYGQPTGPMGRELAGFGPRLGGWIIDWLITGAMLVPGYVYLLAGAKEIEPCSDSISEFEGQLCEVPTGGTWAIAAILWLAGVVGILAYVGILGGKGATIGQRSLGLRLVDQNTGEPIGTGRAILRHLAAILSAIPCYLGYLWNLWDDKKQCWHDKLTSSEVVRG